MNEKIYEFRTTQSNHTPSDYVTLTSVFLEKITIYLPNHITSFNQKFPSIKLPSLTNKLLDDLTFKYSILNKYKAELPTFICAIQNEYFDYLWLETNNKDSLVSEFEIQYKELTLLLDALENYLFCLDKNHIKGINFNYHKADNKSTIIKNFFVVDDIYEAICIGFDLNKKNFSKRKDQLLNSTNKLIYSKATEKLKHQVINSLYRLFDNSSSLLPTESLKIIGTILYLSNIPLQKGDKIEDYDNIDNILKEVSYSVKNLRHYITPRHKIFNYF